MAKAGRVIPLSTHSITWQAREEAEPGEAPTLATLATHVRAVISSPSPSETLAPGGGRGIVDAVLTCDVVLGARHTDLVTDEATGDSWEVVELMRRPGLGFEHLSARLKRVTGVTP